MATANETKKKDLQAIGSIMLTLLTIGVLFLSGQSRSAAKEMSITGSNAQVEKTTKQQVTPTTAMPPAEIRNMVAGNSVDFGIGDSPMLGWILAFPDSGENDLVNFIHQSTGMTTATNYGQNMLSDTGRVRFSMVDSKPVYVSRPRGPYLYTHHLPVPAHTIPTLSHCGGFCNDCFPGKYMLRRDAFIAACAEGVSFEHVDGPHGPTGEGAYHDNKYDSKLVERAVVVVRNPYDVLQDRFIQFSRSYEHLNHRDHEWLPKYVMNREGFHHYCDMQAIKFADEESKWYDPSIFQASLAVPCHAEMFRYIQWYNLAFEAMDYLGIPYMVLHYEEIDGDYAGVETDMLNFFGLSHSAVAPEWYSQGDRGFFSETDRSVLKNFINTMASPSTLNQIGRYL